MIREYVSGPSKSDIDQEDRTLFQRAIAISGSVTALARNLGMNRNTVQGWVTGKNTPTAASILRVREFIRTSTAKAGGTNP